MSDIREQFTALTQAQVRALSQDAWYHSIELPNRQQIPGLISVEALRARLEAFPVPEDLRGKRVLDVGAATGWCSFEMERRGAEVVATDCVEYPDFRTAHRLLGSKVQYEILDIEEHTPGRLGLFDYVLFFGVLYHLRHPLDGLERVCALTKTAAFIESFVTDSFADSAGRPAAKPLLEFYENDDLGGQIDNWFGPNVACLEALCRAAGFARVKHLYTSDRRAGVAGYRHWNHPEGDGPAPWLYSAVNNRTGDLYFHQGKDEYALVYFKPEREVAKDELQVEIDGYAAPVMVLSEAGKDVWQASLRLPPGLSPGPHQVRLRTLSSGFSQRFEIVLLDRGQDAPPLPEPSWVQQADAAPAGIELYEAVNSLGDSAEFHGYRREYLCCRFTSASETRYSRERRWQCPSAGMSFRCGS